MTPVPSAHLLPALNPDGTSLRKFDGRAPPLFSQFHGVATPRCMDRLSSYHQGKHDRIPAPPVRTPR